MSSGSRLSVCACIALLALARSTPADAPATQPVTAATEPSTRPTPQVLALVSDLTSDQFATRESAQVTLQQMGEQVAPQLREILQGPLTDEARARVLAALRRIQEGQEFGASVITIHCKDAPLEGVLQDFAKQSGADLGLHRVEIRPLIKSRTATVDLDHADFWTALSAIEAASGLHARPNGNDGRMILDNTPGFFTQRNDRAKVFGPCLIMPQSVNWSIFYGPGPNTRSTLTLMLVALVEPKLHIVNSLTGDWLRECVDEKGHSLISPGNRQRFFSNPRQWTTQLFANLQVVPDMGTKIARLKGELSLNVQTQSEVMVINDLLSAHNLPKTAGDVTVIVQNVTSENGQFQVHLTVTGPAARWDTVQSLLSSLQVLDESDQPLQQTSTATSQTSATQMSLVVGYYVNRPGLGPPKKLRWEIPTQTKQITVPFELDDLDLFHAADPHNH